MILNSPTISGSLTVTGNIITSGSITISGSIASASYATNAELLDGLDSTVFTLTSSFNTTSASLYTVSSSAYVTSGSLSATSGSLSAASGSLSATSASLSTASGSFNSRVATIESKYATTGSNNFRAPQYVSDTTVPTGFSNTTGSIYTDGGIQVTKDSYFSGSMFIKGNLTIYGTQSVAYITSSQLNIATNLITVNTATPSVRFGGLAVYDSGSTGTGMTGSLLWDSQNNSWIYDNPSGSGNYDSSMVIMGPRNASALGSEQGLNCNYLIQGHGHHHTTSSGIFHDGSTTCFNGSNLFISASGNVGVGTTSPYSNGLSIKGPSDDYSLTVLQQNTNTAGYGFFAGNSGDFSIARLSGGAYTSAALKIQLNTNVVCFASTVCSPTLLTNTISLGGNAVCPTNAGLGYGMFGYSGIGLGIASSANGPNQGIGFFVCGDVERMRIITSGNVGIGTVCPSYLLDVNGTGRFSSTGNALRVASTSTASNVQLYITNNNNGDVYAGVAASDGTSVFTGTTAYSGYIGTNLGVPFYIATNGAVKLTIASTGAATFACSVQGNGGVFSGTGASATTMGGKAATASGLTDKDLTLSAWYATSGTNEYGGDLYLAAGRPTGGGSGKFGSIYIQAGIGNGTANVAGSLGTVIAANNTVLQFFTATTQFVSPTERMQITCTGKVIVGNAAYAGTTTDLSITGDKVNSDGYYSRLMFQNSNQSGGSSASIRGERKTSNYATELTFYTNVGSGTGDGSERMRIACGGNVGIGTSNPQARLQVSSPSDFNAILKISDTGTESTGIIALGDGNTTVVNVGIWRASANSMSSYGNFLNLGGYDGILFATGNTSIGSQTERLRILSSGGATFTSNDGVTIKNTASQYRQIYHYNSNGGDLYFWNGTNQAYLGNSGVWTNASDISIKKDIINIKYGLSDLMNLTPRSYKMKDGNMEQIGFIAQEVETFIPEVVTTDNKDMKGLSYGNLLSVAVKAIQEQQCTINILKTCLGIS